MTRHTSSLAVAIVIALLLCLSSPSPASVNSHGDDLVIDAPWRTVRDYLPVLFFAPDFEENADKKLVNILLHNYAPDTEQSTLIFGDSRNLDLGLHAKLDDNFPCPVSFIDPDGRSRDPITADEPIDSFWHYVARVPVECIGIGPRRGQAGVHYLMGTISWGNPTGEPGAIKHDTKVLRVVVTSDGFAKFSPVDHQFDVHVHTIAEQTKWHGMTNPDASRKAFGGPVAMLFESAYALGLVDIKLDNANWSAYRNKIITTDHNVFFSGPPYDAGTRPGHGPTAASNGKGGEFQWYRAHLGVLGGEEIAVQGANGVPPDKVVVLDELVDTVSGALGDLVGVVQGTSGTPETKEYLALGSHLLAYGAHHIDGPWHGGKLFRNDISEAADNRISISHAMAHMGASNGFGYAAHPESPDIGWSDDYYERSIGLGSFNRSRGDSPILQKNGTEFVFKGLQIWNEHNDMKSRDSGEIEVSEIRQFNPFTVADSGQRFERAPPGRDWRRDHDKTYEAYKRLVRQGLHYSFRERDEHVFIRKLYLSAGTDAHGDFNYSMSIPATALLEAAATINFDSNSLSANTNAFGRLRTYTLTSQRYIRAGEAIPPNCPEFPFCGGARAAPSDFPLEDYKEGNTVVTDGPVGTFAVDGNCRFNSDPHKLVWHDAQCRWENHDGLIGGRGDFDGGNTLLAPVGNEDVLVNAQWIGRNDYLPDGPGTEGPMVFRYVRLKARRPDGADQGPSITAGPRRSLHVNALNEALDNPGTIDFPGKAAVLLEGQLGRRPDETRFITNPVWIAPYRITIDAPTGCPIRPGALKVTLEFGLSMDTTLPESRNGPEAAEPVGVMMSASAQARSYSPGGTRGNALSRVARDPRDAAPVPGSMAPKDRIVHDGIRVAVKPLNSSGNSGDLGFIVSDGDARWEPVVYGEFASRRIQDARYVTSNRMAIPCGGAWDTALHRTGRGLSAYALVVDRIHDMNGNYLNPIATTFNVQDNSGIPDRFREPVESADRVTERVPEARVACRSADAKTCGRYGAVCETLGAGNRPQAALCRWNSAVTPAGCARTAGIWTAATSRFARNHPGAVPPGTSGACVTEPGNLADRIQ